MRLVERKLLAQIAVLIFALSLVSGMAAGQAKPAPVRSSGCCRKACRRKARHQHRHEGSTERIARHR